MPTAAITQLMPCSSVVVFGLLHDYARRLEWDTLLREARFTRGHIIAAAGATTICVGRPFFGIIGIETICYFILTSELLFLRKVKGLVNQTEERFSIFGEGARGGFAC